MSPLLVLILLSSIVNCLQAANHFCEYEDTHTKMEIQLNPSAKRIDNLIPTKRDGRPANLCNWTGNIKPSIGLKQIVLQGFAITTETDRCTAALEYTIYKLDGGKPKVHRAHPGHFQVLSGTNVSKLDVWLNISGSATHSCRTGLRIEFPTLDNGRCGRDMLEVGGSCFAMSSSPGNLTQAMTNIKADAQLASFSSIAEIEEFVAANNARGKMYPFVPPLNLTQPVLIGIFTGAAEDAVFFVVRNETRCWLEKFLDPQKIRNRSSERACVSLRVDKSNRFVIESVDCNQPLPFLVSFPLIPSRMLTWEQCSGQLTTLLNKELGSDGGTIMIIIIVIIAAVILLIPAVILAAICAFRSCNRCRQSSIELAGAEERSKKLRNSNNNEQSDLLTDAQFTILMPDNTNSESEV